MKYYMCFQVWKACHIMRDKVCHIGKGQRRRALHKERVLNLITSCHICPIKILMASIGERRHAFTDGRKELLLLSDRVNMILDDNAEEFIYCN